MPSNPMENDMLLMNEAFREAMGDISQTPVTKQFVSVLRDGEPILTGLYRSFVQTSFTRELKISQTDPKVAKSALFLTESQCDGLDLGDDVVVNGGTIKSVGVEKTGTLYIITLGIMEQTEVL